MTEQKIKAGDESTNIQQFGNGSIHVVSGQKEKYEFIKEIIGIAITCISGVVAALTNPPPEQHLQQIQRGFFVGYQLDKELYYDNSFLFSNVYTIGAKGEKIVLSYGYFGKVVESEDYNFNQQKLNKFKNNL